MLDSPMAPDRMLMPLALPIAADEALVMDEDAFRAFYERTSRPVWAYLRRITGNASQADDLLQETYYRFVRVGRSFDDDAHRLHYLFRVAMSVAHDAHRRQPVSTLGDDVESQADGADAARAFEQRADLERAMAKLRPRDRELLWLAYAQGSTHEEIAAELGVGRPSVKVMLSRARQRLAQLLGRTRGDRPEVRS
jgi:RNA polymerase sigma-70 factor, ECF subfamily